MTTKSSLATPIFAVPLLVLLFWTSSAQASLTWEFGFDNTSGGFGGTGVFTFNESGSGVEEFSFRGTCGGNLCTFGTRDVFGAFAQFNDDGTFSRLELEAQTVNFGELWQADVAIFNDQLFLTCLSLQPVGSQTNCNGMQTDERRASIGSGAFLTPVHTSVPVPATLLLFGLGLAGIGFGMRRR